MYALTQSPHFVLIDLQSETSVDRDVTPAAIEYVVHNVVSKRLKADGLSGSACLLSIDSPVRYFERVSKRGAIPMSNVIDCYTSWYGDWTPHTISGREATIQPLWHIARTPTLEETTKVLVQAVESASSKTQTSQSRGRIIVIDSLSSILSLSPSLDTVLHLLDSFAAYNVEISNSRSPITLIATIRSSQLKLSLLEGLRKLANTHVLVSQLSLKRNKPAPFDEEDDRDIVRIEIRKRKVSGRMHFEEHVAKMDWDNVQLHEIENGLKGLNVQRRESEHDNTKEEESLELAQHGLSFRVTLSSKEREVRAAAGLPYLHTDEELANSALTIHPENLRVRKSGVDEIERDSSSSSEIGSDGEDLFSEDV